MDRGEARHYDKRIVIDQNSIINMSGEASIVGTSRRFNVPAEDIPITNDAVIEPVRCNILPARPSGGVSGTYALDAPGISLQNNQSVSQPNINIRVPGCKTLEEIKAWLTDMMPHLHMGLRFEPLPVHPNNSKEASTC